MSLIKRMLLVLTVLAVLMIAVLAFAINPEAKWQGMSRQAFEAETNAFGAGPPDVLNVFYGIPLILAKGYEVSFDYNADTGASYVIAVESFWQFLWFFTLNQSVELGFRSGIFCFTRHDLRCDFVL